MSSTGAERQAKFRKGKAAEGSIYFRAWILAESEADCIAAVAIIQAAYEGRASCDEAFGGADS